MYTDEGIDKYMNANSYTVRKTEAKGQVES